MRILHLLSDVFTCSLFDLFLFCVLTEKLTPREDLEGYEYRENVDERKVCCTFIALCVFCMNVSHVELKNIDNSVYLITYMT